MPVEYFVLGFVIFCLLAIVARFLPRDAAGEVQLPDIVDGSIGMYTLRRLLRRPTDPLDDAEAWEIIPTPEEVAYRIGSAGAARPMLRLRPRSATAGDEPRLRTARRSQADLIRARIRRNAGLIQQRRLAAVLVTVLGAMVVGVVTVMPESPSRGGVLGATGTPARENPAAQSLSPEATGEPVATPATTP